MRRGEAEGRKYYEIEHISPDIINIMIKLGRVKWVKHVTCMKAERIS
jgi:hypothetical protein